MFSNMLTPLLLTIVSLLVAAIPMPQFSLPPADTKYYYLKAVVTQPYANPSAHSDFNNTYLESYHTGAGLSDGTLNASTQNAVQAFLNGTNQQFNLTAADGYFPWSMFLPDDPYSVFSPVNINAGLPDTNSVGAFYFNQSAQGSLWFNYAGNATDPYYGVDDNSFGGWLACNWVHYNQPQLFWLNSFYAAQSELPSNCAPVLLVPEYLN